MHPIPKSTFRLSPQRRALLELWLSGEGLGNSKTSAITPILSAPRNGPLPLSFAQERFWVLDQTIPDGSVYNISGGLHLNGPLRVAALQASLQEIARRHEILRTIFLVVDGHPVQKVRPFAPRVIPVISLEDLPKKKQEESVLQSMREESNHRFDLADGPLLRCKILHLGVEKHLLLMNFHHIVFDGWSVGIFLNELGALYSAFLREKPSPLPEPPIQYADFACWQRQPSREEIFETQLVYWKKQLKGCPPILDLQRDHPRPAVQTFKGAVHTADYPASLTAMLKTLGQKNGATLFMVLLAAFKILLFRYTSQTDIVVGAPVANRTLSQLEEVIGCFINTLILRTDLSGDPSFLELLLRIREVTVNAYAHQDLPYSKLVKALQPDRPATYSPLFQVAFTFWNAPLPVAPLEGLVIEWFECERVTSKHDLTLSVIESSHGLRGEWEYNTDIFEKATIERMAGHFHTLLEGIVVNPDQRLSELPLLPQAELNTLLLRWNNTSREISTDASVCKLFETQVQKTPSMIAVAEEDTSLTYEELNRRANQLAHHLRKLGVGPGAVVGVLLERSIEMVVTILGILKAGGAYLPLDVHCPKERLLPLFEDTKIGFLVTLRRHLDGLPENEARRVCLDSGRQAIASESEKNPAVTHTPNDLCYAIHTSGSTGRPKTAAVYHRGWINLLLWYISEFQITGSDRILLVSSPSFDLTQKNIIAPLLVGAQLHLFHHEIYDPKAIRRTIAKRRISLINCTPSHFYPLVEGAADSAFASLSTLRCVILGGEVIAVSRLMRWAASEHCKAELVNTYGPTECTDIVAYHKAARPWRPDEPALAIGRPIPNTKLFIVDASMNPVPIGVCGELCVSGAALGAGYLQDPELTAERFIKNPFGNEKNSLLYKTGDWARYREDGNIEFLGRMDSQIKVRGFRVELGEIENTLRRHPGIKEAAVLAREDAAGDQQLEAYLFADEDQPPTVSHLQSFLRSYLPDYMVPSAFIMMDRLPLSPNGKIDKKALSLLEKKAVDPGRQFIAARNSTEFRLAQIWETLFEISPVGVRDNFFRLGGHSLLAVRLMSHIEEEFGRELPLSSLFQHATVEEQAGLILESEGNSSGSPLVLLQPKGLAKPIFFVHALDGTVLCYAELARQLGSARPIYGIQAKGMDEMQDPLMSVSDMAAAYIQALRQVQTEGPYLLGGWSFGGFVAFEMAKQLQSDGQTVGLVLLLDSYRTEKLDEARALQGFVDSLSRRLNISLTLPRLDLKVSDTDECFQCLWEQLINSNRLPPYAQASQIRRLARVFQANVRAAINYSIPEVSLPIHLMLASEGPAPTPEIIGSAPDPVSSWGALSSKPLGVHRIPGDHYTLLARPHVEVLASVIQSCLAAADRAVFHSG